MTRLMTAEPAVVPERPNEVDTFRDRFTSFVDSHVIAWELTMAALAVVFVVAGFLDDGVEGQAASTFEWISIGITGIFVAEFAARFLATRHRAAYLRGHWIDLVALVPFQAARGLRIARLVRIFRLARAFAAVGRASGSFGRLASNRGIATLVIALFGTTLLSSAAFFVVESDNHPNLRPVDALWWGITTLTGGPNEILAMTDEGKVAASVLLLIGVALFTGITALFVTSLMAGHQRTSTRVHSRAESLSRLAALREDEIITPEEFDLFAGRVWPVADPIGANPV
jgi:voltage-gated potassium channel